MEIKTIGHLRALNGAEITLKSITCLTSQSLRYENRFNLHSLAILLLANLAMIVNIPNIDIHLDDVIKNRRDRMEHLLPPIAENYNPGLDPNALDPNQE